MQTGSLFGTAAQFQSPRQPAAVRARKRMAAKAKQPHQDHDEQKAIRFARFCCRSAADRGEWSAISFKETQDWKKAGRSWHHHSCALRHRLIGAGGITGWQDDAQAPGIVPAPQNNF
jgi:hypothetical protein